ncbi:hypothetical protein ACQ5SK_24600 [Bradyrhizobium japonicum]
MPVRFKGLALVAAIGAVALGAMGPVSAQAIQERTIRWGHLNNTDHPVSKGVQKFAEIVAAKSGGKIKVRDIRPTSWAARCSSNRRCAPALRRCSRRRRRRWSASSRITA